MTNPTAIVTVRDTSVRGRAPRRHRLLVVLLAGVAVLAVAVLLSLFVGANPVASDDVRAALLGTGSDEADFVVWDQRVPRTVAALAVGAALGVAGALMQAFTRNPLADPGILGVNAGAGFAVAVGLAFLGVRAPGDIAWLACGGALVVTLVVYAIGSGGREQSSTARLTVTGVAFGAVLAGLTTGIAITHPDAFDRMRGWNAGSLLERDLGVVVPVLPFLAVGLVLAAASARSLNAIALGPDVARSQGVSVARSRILVLASVTLLAGGATAIAGPIAFVGLVVPHLVRWSVGSDQRRILGGSVLVGCVLVLCSDVVGRIAVLPGEMPVGLVTAFVGAPVLIALARRRTASGL
ncbi:iron complex transport system permease protein [Plantibacter flavus]|uniref:Iron complex transport system permease protein n=1 Tax=Plantibacter flavus TaxID=150123 RepID=A0A3N2C4X6_9MICO|nr:iron chelate uptake ABC transporter family permease subunit [Plantibacter flavus]ROR82571.1 iron complex transport system permease protein [Plantibacter flavus]SMG38486.1 iron complex transport system permease protein [Plantibacter flavus]